MRQRLRIALRGAVQGVGFRPFIYRLANEMGLAGWVLNSGEGVFIEAEGEKSRLEAFVLRIEKERPPRSFIQSLESSYLDPVGFSGFEIRPSDGAGGTTALVLPDIATCPDCRREIFDPSDRRFLYPFTNCTNCGPRFTIIESLPYDRSGTTMKKFSMCRSCRNEYDDPLDRRFHAQPNACADCGPQLELRDESGRPAASHHRALLRAAEAIREGRIVAVKGLGGFHLIADARSEIAVLRLRERKRREGKPFALMYPSLSAVAADCGLSELEERLLLSPESPIVLLRRKERPSVAPSVAPGNPCLGVMLPYTPLHHILSAELGFPVVATSGNRAEEPICTDENEAVKRLGGIADLYLAHDRPIVRHADDSIARVMVDRELVLRRARGYAPLPIRLSAPAETILAVGGHLKNTVALTVGKNVFISQHIGDLETREAGEAFREVIGSFEKLYKVRPERVACDLHPDYFSSRYARQSGLPVVEVQHHMAHVASCMAENELSENVLGVSWDGTGFGTDGTIWGGEFLRTDGTVFERVATFRRFRLPGGAAAVREPRRTAIGVLYEILGDALFDRDDLVPLRSFSAAERSLLRTMLSRGIYSPWATSAGRLFDAVASLAGLRQRVKFEGQAAMELEFSIGENVTEEAYAFRISNPPFPIVFDWEPMVRAILEDLGRGLAASVISARFHNALVEAVVDIARRIGEEKVVLTGGCFQNRYLTERAVHRLSAEGFRPYWHQRVPPNDGGIALGQTLMAIASTREPRTAQEAVRWAS